MTTKSKTAKIKPAAEKSNTHRRQTNTRAPAKTTQRRSSSKSNASLRENTKLATVIAMLRRKEGATIEELMKATGWQAHSVRGALSGALKKKLGLTVTSTKTDGVRTYHVTD